MSDRMDLSDEIKIGSQILNNDPRMPNRIRIVVAIVGNQVCAQTSIADKTGKTWVNRKFIHTDGKPRRSGWSLVS